VEEMRLLRFRWGNNEYGIPVEDLAGVVEWPMNGPAKSDPPIPILGLQAGIRIGNNKQALILNDQGVEIALIVDEVLEIAELADTVATIGLQACFRIWRFDD
jgi:chemotaxis signal transduction protein